MIVDTPIVLTDIVEERQRQDSKWGLQNHKPVEWMSILMEEVGEVSKEVCEHHFGYRGDQKERLQRMRKELVEVAAVAVAMIESLDRNELA